MNFNTYFFCNSNRIALFNNTYKRYDLKLKAIIYGQFTRILKVIFFLFLGANLTKVAEDVAARLGLSMENIRAQTYDGASNMQGKKSGCGTLIKKKYPLALQFHCRAHAANLVIQAASESCTLVDDAISTVHKLAKLFKSSKKVRTFVDNKQYCNHRLKKQNEQSNIHVKQNRFRQ